MESRDDLDRPRTLADCAGGERPCPHVSCQHHQYLDVNPATGRLQLNFPALEPWAHFWYTWVSVAFLKAYLAVAKDEHFLPKDPIELQVLLDAYLLEKAVYELGYELNSRPDWLKVPLRGLLQLLVASR